jgi:hypothetical protein
MEISNPNQITNYCALGLIAAQINKQPLQHVESASIGGGETRDKKNLEEKDLQPDANHPTPNRTGSSCLHPDREGVKV